MAFTTLYAGYLNITTNYLPKGKHTARRALGDHHGADRHPVRRDLQTVV